MPRRLSDQTVSSVTIFITPNDTLKCLRSNALRHLFPRLASAVEVAGILLISPISVNKASSEFQIPAA